MIIKLQLKTLYKKSHNTLFALLYSKMNIQKDNKIKKQG